MDRITNPGVVPDPREFIEGDPETGLPATPLDVAWLNALQEELCAVIEHNSGTLDPNSRTQLRDKILALFNSANAASMDGLPIEMAGADDGYLLKVTGVYPNLQVVAVPTTTVATPTVVATRWFDSVVEVILGTTYRKASTSAPTGVSASMVNTTTTANTENLVVEFTSQATTQGFTILPGRWSVHLWDNANNSGAELRIKIFDLNETTGIRTQIGATHSYPVPNIVSEYSTYEVQAADPVIIAPGHRLVFSFYAFSTSNNRSVTLTFDGVDRQSYFEVPVAQTHNDLGGLQGGAGSERYHLTQAAAAAAEQLVATPPPSPAKVDIFTTSGTWIKPANAKSVHILAMGAGGGGASGQAASSINSSAAGGGGAGGSALEHLVEASILPATMAIIIGVGGNGGNPSSGLSHNGGAHGGDTLVQWGGEPYRARGGAGALNSFAAASTPGFYPGGAGGNTGVAATVPENGAGIGGSGGGQMSSGTAYGGAYSRYPRRHGENAFLSTGGAGGSGGDAIDTGAGSPSDQLYKYPGLGGGGGGSGYNANGGRGGNAGHGGGGGGGGAALTGYQSGAGGKGGDGIVVITTWM